MCPPALERGPRTFSEVVALAWLEALLRNYCYNDLMLKHKICLRQIQLILSCSCWSH